jgi:hypothetical protein
MCSDIKITRGAKKYEAFSAAAWPFVDLAIVVQWAGIKPIRSNYGRCGTGGRSDFGKYPIRL